MNAQPDLVSLCRALMLMGCSLAGAGCSTQEVADNPLKSRAWWKGDGVAGKPRIVINLTTQRVNYYKGKELVGVSPISSGRESHGTVTGSFRILDKDLDHRSSLFGAYVDNAGNVVKSDVDTRKDAPPPGTKYEGASMRYFMRIVGGIGMHEGYLPGYPASHGCIRLPTKMAVIFYKETPEGTPVEIIGQSSLAATEAAIPIGAEKIEDAAPELDTKARRKAEKEAKALAEAKAKAQKAAPRLAKYAGNKPGAATPPPVLSVTAAKAKDEKPKTTVRRAIVENSKSSKPSKPGSGSWFDWMKSTPRGTTIYWQP